MTKLKNGFYLLLFSSVFIILVSGCSPSGNQNSQDIPSPTRTLTPTETSAPTFTPTFTPMPTPTPFGGGVGKILYAAYDFESESVQIYSFNTDGAEHRSVLELDDLESGCFHYSPYRESVAFVHESKVDGGGQEHQLMLADADFSNPPLVVDNGFENIDSLAWSSNGKYIAYFGYKIDRYTLTVADLNSDVPIIETVFDPPFLSISTDINWSPNKNQFLISLIWGGNWEIMVVDVEEKTFEPFISHPGMDYRVQWSPDGRYISFASNRDEEYTWEQIFVMNSDGSNITNVTNDPNTDGRFHSWSPDSTRIAYLTYRDNPPAYLPDWSIYTIKPDGTGITRVSGDILNPGKIQWSPDGKLILFQKSRFDDSRFDHHHYITASDGSTEPRILPEWMTLDMDWSPAAWSPDGKQLVFYDEGKIYLTSIDATEKPDPLIKVDPKKYYSCFTWQP